MMKCNCIIYHSISKIKDIDDSVQRVCTCCDLVKEYSQLVYNGSISLEDDLAKFNPKKHHHKRKRRVKNASDNKSGSNRTLSKGRKKPTNKQK